MRYLAKPRTYAAALLFSSLLAGGAHAAVNVLIQPSGDGSKTYFTVSWDSLTGSSNFGNGPWSLGNSVDHTVIGSSSANWQLWQEFGDYKSSTTNELFLRNGTPDYFSTVTGFGLYLDNDTEGGVGDDFGITFDGGTVPASGSFVAETTTWSGGFAAMWKTGTHAGPGGSTIIVTASPIPEPATSLFAALGALALLQRRRKA
jgi:hypothetical protein